MFFFQVSRTDEKIHLLYALFMHRSFRPQVCLHLVAACCLFLLINAVPRSRALISGYFQAGSSHLPCGRPSLVPLRGTLLQPLYSFISFWFGLPVFLKVKQIVRQSQNRFKPLAECWMFISCFKLVLLISAGSYPQPSVWPLVQICFQHPHSGKRCSQKSNLAVLSTCWKNSAQYCYFFCAALVPLFSWKQEFGLARSRSKVNRILILFQWGFLFSG